MKSLSIIVAALATLAVSACLHHNPPAPAGADPWLRTRGPSDCAQPACLFAVVVDSAGRPLGGVDVEVETAGVQATSTTRGRIVLQGIAIGPHRLRVTVNGNQTETEPIGFGFNFQALTIQLRGDSVRIRT